MRLIIITIALALVLPLSASAEPVTWEWTPASGPVVDYGVWISQDGVDWEFVQTVGGTQVTLEADPDTDRIAVQGRSEEGHLGPFSPASRLASEVEPQPVPPIGQPGQPVRVTIEGTLTVE